jgi:hypothetical protein
MHACCRLEVESDADARFVALLRHSHVMPFVPLKDGESAEISDGDLFAVLQPLDGIAWTTLSHFGVAHERRARVTEWDAAPDATPLDSVRSWDTELGLGRSPVP